MAVTENYYQELFDPRIAQAMADADESFWAEKAVATFWFCMMIAMVVCQLGAMMYDITLSVYQSLSMPFLFCFMLAWVGGSFPKRRRQKHLNKMQEVVQELKNEHYRLSQEK